MSSNHYIKLIEFRKQLFWKLLEVIISYYYMLLLCTANNSRLSMRLPLVSYHVTTAIQCNALQTKKKKNMLPPLFIFLPFNLRNLPEKCIHLFNHSYKCPPSIALQALLWHGQRFLANIWW